MSRYIDLKRIEFVVTDACSGRCKHCSRGELRNIRGNVDTGVVEGGNVTTDANAAIGVDASIDANAADSWRSVDADATADVVMRLAGRYAIESVMTFGGEPLLFADTVCKIHAAARDCGIPKRQLITNGFFSKDGHKIDDVAAALCEAGVNDVLLSVDTFHQEYIPLEPVELFAEALLRHNAPSLRMQPAWVVNEGNENRYNAETKRLLHIFTQKGIIINDGNNITPSGNALKYLSEYFSPRGSHGSLDLSAPCGTARYTSRLDEINSFGISPNGDVGICSISIGNIYADDILDIVDNYDPYANPAWRAVLDGGAAELLRYAQIRGVAVDINECRSACDACKKIMAAIKNIAH